MMGGVAWPWLYAFAFGYLLAVLVGTDAVSCPIRSGIAGVAGVLPMSILFDLGPKRARVSGRTGSDRMAEMACLRELAIVQVVGSIAEESNDDIHETKRAALWCRQQDPYEQLKSNDFRDVEDGMKDIR
ncbi:MAG: hypothetical protein OXR82_06470 [Gammaproteobacteria bacterium]|nr:hypothetical protein [Gammaproteobacteria bacterium]